MPISGNPTTGSPRAATAAGTGPSTIRRSARPGWRDSRSMTAAISCGSMNQVETASFAPGSFARASPPMRSTQVMKPWEPQGRHASQPQLPWS